MWMEHIKKFERRELDFSLIGYLGHNENRKGPHGEFYRERIRISYTARQQTGKSKHPDHAQKDPTTQ